MVNSLFDITGKKAIVTGGTRGLGKGMAEGLMESGAEVAIIGTSDKVYQVADEFKARGFVCYGVKADLSDRDQCNEAFNKCVELLGDLDILADVGLHDFDPPQQNEGVTEEEQVETMFNAPVFSTVKELARWAYDNGCWSTFRKNYGLWKDIQNESKGGTENA